MTQTPTQNDDQDLAALPGHWLPRQLRLDIEDFLQKNEARSPDAFGMDMDVLKKALTISAHLYHYYFRCEVSGIENIPPKKAVLAANHGGQLPFDGLMITTAAALKSRDKRICRSMVDKMVPTLPFISTLFAQMGVVTGTRNNARRLLENDEMLLTFPEGIEGIQKPLSKAYRLEHFGLGFVRLALRCKAPIIPVAVVGSEEQYPTLYKIERPSRFLKLPSIPIWAQLPLPLLGLLPLPVKYHIMFGEPIRFKGDPDDVDEAIAEKAMIVKNEIKKMLDTQLAQRKSVFY